ncbi:MAG: phosphate uptake regulator PhoU [Candidatus Bathyarchaeota archaeon]|nr:phosphate uptake regulator PhoU [Candidatus Bathyarchaeum sp.]
MDLRKIQRTSGGTFFVCLPKDWAEKNGLDRGAVVSVTETADGTLVINPKYNVERSPQVAVITPSSLLDRVIIEKYLLGYDIIQVQAKDRISPMDRERVKQASTRLVGLEIVEENHSKIVMQCLLEPSTFPPQKILRREYSIVSGVHRDAMTALLEGDVELAKNVVARDNEVNRLYFLLVRVLRTVIQHPGLSEKLGILPIDCLDYRLAASLVESIGDHSASIGKTAIQLAGAKIAENLSQQLLQLHQIAYNSHENAINAVFYRDVSVAESVRAEKKKIAFVFHEIETAILDLPAEMGRYLLAVASSIRRIYDNSLDIADLVMPKLP